jgi:ribonuclease P protein component
VASTLRQQRIAAKSEFDYIFSHGKRYARRNLVFIYTPSAHQQSRLAVVVSKKCFKHAVQRNYIKRILRVFFQTLTTLYPVDVVVIARPSIARVEPIDRFTTVKNHWEDFAKCLASC